MSYFDHAFKKTFVGTGGFVTAAGTTTSQLTTGQFAFVDPKTWEVPVDVDSVSALKCPLVLVSGSIHPNDKIGPFSGGYSESVKSKTINPKYVSAFYKVEPCSLQQMQITVGSNYLNQPTTGSSSLDCNLNSGSVVNREFLCNSTYNLRVDIKGSPVLRYLTRNNYYTAAAYTGCCAEGVDGIGQPVNPLLVYVQWAYQLLNSPLISPFIQVQVTYTEDYDDATAEWFQLAGTNGTNSTANLEALLAYINDPTTLPAVVNYTTYVGTTAYPGLGRAGLIITGAYADTRFEDCTFYPNDSIIAFLEPVKVYASEVDLNGDPCAFGGVCVANVCAGNQGTGFGESVIRDLIMTEAYMQQPFYTGQDLRIREITNGTDVYDVINRSSSYTRYYIQHNVPRFNNPSSTFDNDQYLLQIIVTEGDTVTGIDSTAASTNIAANATDPALTQITVTSTAGLEPGMLVSITSGTGALIPFPYIYEVVSATQFTITNGTNTSPASAALDATTVLEAVTDYTYSFEDFVQTWLINAGSGCTTMETIACADTCEYVEPDYTFED